MDYTNKQQVNSVNLNTNNKFFIDSSDNSVNNNE